MLFGHLNNADAWAMKNEAHGTIHAVPSQAAFRALIAAVHAPTVPSI
jgi:hypothetical protein